MDCCWCTYFNAILLYILAVLVFFVIPAALNISFGLQRHYVNLLQKIFEYGRKRIEEEHIVNEASKHIIEHNTDKVVALRKTSSAPQVSIHSLRKQFKLDDVLEYTTAGIAAIIEDEVTCRLDAAELSSWNLLTRTNLSYQFISWRLTFIWFIGFFVRYFLFLPVRATIFLIGFSWLVCSMAVVSQIRDKTLKKSMTNWAALISFRILTSGFAALVNYHNRENMAKGGGICVANHTSMLDPMLLSCDRNYTLTGQIQDGIIGVMQKALLKSDDHAFVDDNEVKDRRLVVERMREHVRDESKNPVLIFPEGTFVNNTSVMMFKKGSFEVGGPVYPVAIKYDPVFGNAFWNPAKESVLTYLMKMFTSWSVVCDIWYLPVATRNDGESATAFARRVKHDIAVQGGLVDLVWDGGLNVPLTAKEQQQKKFAIRLKSN